MNKEQDYLLDYSKRMTKIISTKVSIHTLISIDITNEVEVDKSKFKQSNKEEFSFEENIIHTLGVINTEGDKYIVKIKDPYEFNIESDVIDITKVDDFGDVKGKFFFDATSNEISPL